MIKNVLIGFLLLLSIGFLGTVQAEELNWRPMGLLDSDIVFYGEVFDLDFITAVKAQKGDYTTEYQFQAWNGNAGEYVEILSVELIVDQYWARLYDFEESLSEWKGNDISWLDKGTAVSVLGRNKYQRFNSGSDNCFIWRVVFNSGSFTRFDNAYVQGTYCQKDEIEGNKLISMIKSIGFRKAKVPPKPKIE